MRLDFRLFYFAAVGILAPDMPAAAPPVRIRGYPLNLSESSDLITDNAAHPMIGRFLCPSLTRLNLLKKESEPFLLERIAIVPRANTVEWEMVLRKGTRWWNGTLVSPNDLKVFLVRALKEELVEVELGLWDTPEFEVNIGTSDVVAVHWLKPPVFGPYILSRIPFSRGEGKDRECAGEYRAVVTDKDIVFTPVTKGSKLRDVVFTTNSESHKSKVDLDFQLPENFSKLDQNSIGKEPAQCPRPIDLPIVTVLAWNPNGRFTRDAEFRRTMTQALPRGALLRVGMGLLGDLISGPLLRAHPGYDRSLLVRPFDLRIVAELMEQLNYKRPVTDGMRMTPEGKPLELKLYAPNAAGLVQKLVVDSFNILGVKISFVTEASPDIDGTLSGMSLSWPEADFLPLFHSKAKVAKPFWNLQNKELDVKLEQYAISLTEAQPHFEALQGIHRILYNEEPLTILVQHRTCLVASTKFRSEIPKVIIRNPDWFFDLING